MSVSSADVRSRPVPPATPGPDGELSLLDLPVGETARVTRLCAGDDADGAALGFRLAEIGFLPGETVRVIARAAFGGPLAVRVGSSTFALRRVEAAAVSVQGGG